MANTLRLDGIFCGLALTLLFASCSGSETPEPARKPVPVSGQQIYEQRCSFCHGTTGAGDTSVGGSFPNANLSDGVWAHGSTPEEISNTIDKGVPQSPMEGYHGLLSPDEINRVRDYILAMKR